MRQVPLEGDLDPALAELPACPGVGQIAAAGGTVLVTGCAANLRRWAASNLGAGPAPRKGVRPRTNLRPIATAIRWVETTSGFLQRRVYERLMAPLVPLRERRDLKPPSYLHLDPNQRFPRLDIRPAATGDDLFGPFRNRAAALAAVTALQRLFPLRPCELEFEPAPGLTLGLACLYAQVKSCAAPCLQRVTEPEYRTLALRTQAVLEAAWSRREAPAIPAWVSRTSARAVIVERGRSGIELHPVADGAVLDEAAQIGVPEADLPAACARLTFAAPCPPRDDRAWLSAWLHGRRSGHYLVLAPAQDAGQIVARVRVLDDFRVGGFWGAEPPAQ